VLKKFGLIITFQIIVIFINFKASVLFETFLLAADLYL